ncbi:MAG: type II secretion system protein [Candidatus Omnitrophica bacterium]|nr:type II secretion system protein [Candidatus Omnitrophota bacterium]
MKVKDRLKGFTLFEILVSVVLIGIGLYTMVVGYRGGTFLLRQAENKSRLMSVALARMERYLTKSYSALEVGNFTGSEVYSSGMKVDWEALVSERHAGSAPGPVIPYKHISVIASYLEDNMRGGKNLKEARLVNIKPYPYIHSTSRNFIPDDATPLYASTTPSSIDGVKLVFDYEVEKNLLVVYNIAIDVKDPDGLVLPSDTLYTQCYLQTASQPAVSYPIETRTPLLTQPLISNIVGINDVAAGEHTLLLYWNKEFSRGTVSLREANIVVMAFEK